MGNPDRVEVLARQSLSLSQELGDTRGIADSLSDLANVALERGKVPEAVSLSEERVRLMRQVGEPGEVAEALFSLADQVGPLGEYSRQQALFEEALALFRKAGNELWVGATLVYSALRLWFSLGDPVTIVQRLQQGRALISKVGDRGWSAACSNLAALVALSEGELARAYDLAQEALAIYRELDARYFVGVELSILGRVQAQQGDRRAAVNSYQQSLAISRELGARFIIPFNLEGLASVAAAEGELRWAAQLWGAAEALREANAQPLPPVDRASYERLVAAARTQLREKAFALAWAEGSTMKLEQVLAAREPVTLPEHLPEARQIATTVKTSSSYPAELTAREVEVLRLVAQGLSDAQIAEQLVISPRTVNWHLTSIYSKLQVSSRAAATRFAIEQHLV